MSVRDPVTRRHKSMCCLVPSRKMGRMIHCESMLEGDAVGIVAAQANLNAPLVSTLIGVGIPLGLCSAPAWHWLFLSLAH